MKSWCTPLALLLIGAGVHAQQPQSLDTSAKAILAAASAYLTDYEPKLSYLLADEAYTQRVDDRGGAATATRTMQSEVFLTYLPVQHEWITVRDIATVDGRPVEDRQDLQTLLAHAPVADLARTLAEQNARFNIGGIERTFNDPTIGLQIVEPRNRSRFKFDRARVETDGGPPIVVLSFKEHDRPTMISWANGEPVYSTGEIAIEAGTGRVRQTTIELDTKGVRASVATTYGDDERLGLWVPRALTEHYERTSGTPRQTITCEATYTNYRKFDVNVIIK